MARNKIDDLNNHLFATIEGLLDEQEPMDVKRAQAVADVARVLIESAKVEVNFLRITGDRENQSQFFSKPKELMG
jgi:hypothetical protein